jgi:membrane associated rhomboid family serine protease
MWSVNTWIIVICVAVFLLNAVFGRVVFHEGRQYLVRPIEQWGFFSVYTAVMQGQIWRFITFQFLHANLNHLLFNMLALYFFGPLIEGYLGSRRYLIFYLICGVAGPIMYMLFWALGFMIQDPRVEMVGASAGIFGVLVAAAVIAPNATVLIYGIFPMKLKAMALVLLAIAGYTVWTGGANAGGEAAHLGGAAMGFLLIRRQHWLNLFNFGGNRRRFATRL